jgi:protein-cysteine N-palmitoyltransferase HHAT
MPEDIIIDMPSDLHSARVPAPLELDMPAAHDAVDTRKGILKATVHIPSSTRRPGPEQAVSAPRWFTLEFYSYYVAALIVIPIMVWIPVRLSSRV